MAGTDSGCVAAAMAVARAGRRAGRPLRDIAVDLYGRERVAAAWHADGRMRAQLRRLLRRAGARCGIGPGAA